MHLLVRLVFQFITSTCCFEKLSPQSLLQFYSRIGKFRIESASNGTQYQCDIRASDTELECSIMALKAQSPIGFEAIPAIETIVMVEGSNEGWSMMANIMTVTETQAAHDRLFFSLSGPHSEMNVFYDDINFVHIPKDCQQQMLNSDFEVGDSRFWYPTAKKFIDFEIVSSGISESQYSMMIQPRLGQFEGVGLRQNIDSRCILEGQEYLISAKFRLLDVANLDLGVACDPAKKTVNSVTHCPTVTIHGTNCAGGDVEYLFFNEKESFIWDKEKFNEYERVFTVNADFASCEVSIVFFNFF